MVEDRIQIIDINAEILEGANLLLCLSNDKLNLVISKPSLSSCIFKSYNFNSNQQLQDVLPFNIKETLGCSKILLSLRSDKFVIVPASFFDPKAAKEYLHQVHELDGKFAVRHKLIKTIDSFIVFAESEFIASFISYVPRIDMIYPRVDCFIQYISKDEQKADFYLDFDDRSFVLYLVQNEEIAFIEQFYFTEASDTIYFILGVLQRFMIDPVTAKVVLSGSIMPYSEIYNAIYTFVGEIEWFDPEKNFFNLKLPNKTNLHTVSDVFCLSLCV